MKNAFDLNRDILKMLTNYNQNADPHMKVFMQIITRLTTVNNQAMISSIDLIQQKHILKQEVIPLQCRTCVSILLSISLKKNCKNKSNLIKYAICQINRNF
jgi:S-adenosylmethionine:diacylglycerol 3-amino-3-carboxypropyl transferase